MKDQHITSGAQDLAHPPFGRFVPGGGVTLHMVEEGAGPAVILIHGASGNCRDFSFSLMGKLARSYRAIAFDRPGHGHSERPSGAEAPDIQARAMIEAARALGMERALVVGHSYGAAVALAWALAAPEMTAGLLLLSGATHPWPGGLSASYRLSTWPGFSWALRTLARRRADSIVNSIFAPAQPPTGYADYVGVDLALRRSTFLANARDVLALHGHLSHQHKHYPSITAPIEIIHGLRDEIVPSHLHADLMVKDVASARLHRLDDAGHMPHHTHEDHVLAAIDRLTLNSGLSEPEGADICAP